jgi:lysophospholipase L1-like esterase
MGTRRRLLAWLGAGCVACAPLPGPTPPGVERIVFLGDSLVSRSEQDHRLLERVAERVHDARPGLALDVVNAGVSGNCIADIRARLKDVLALSPSAVVLYWDSDAADVEGPADPPARVGLLRAAYERDLGLVLDGLHAITPRVVVSGPTLMGERPHGRNAKDHVLDAYAEINGRLCLSHHATWVDTRRAAFRWLRRNNSEARRDAGLLTEDGEHLSAAGVSLVARRFARALLRHLAPPSPELPREPQPAPQSPSIVPSSPAGSSPDPARARAEGESVFE